MNTWIALFRGVNVGGHRKLPMAALTQTLEALDFADVKTYIQSGNVVFRRRSQSATRLATKIAAAVESEFGFQADVLVLSLDELRESSTDNPFDPGSDGKTVHFFFLAYPPKNPALDTLDAAKSGREAFELSGRVLYLYTPDGFGRSKLATRVERALGVRATGRNARTVAKLLELAAKVT